MIYTFEEYINILQELGLEYMVRDTSECEYLQVYYRNGCYLVIILDSVTKLITNYTPQIPNSPVWRT